MRAPYRDLIEWKTCFGDRILTKLHSTTDARKSAAPHPSKKRLREQRDHARGDSSTAARIFIEIFIGRGMKPGIPSLMITQETKAADRAFALSAATECAERGFVVYAMCVGYGADRALMQEVESRTNLREFFASAAPEEYTEEHQTIFRSIGGKRPVALIE